MPSLRPPPPALALYPHPNLTRALLHVLALALVDRSGEPVQVNAARYTTYHDAEGIGAFLDADFKALTSVLSFTVDYLAGTPRHVDAAHSVAYTVPQSGAWRACGALCPSPRVNRAIDACARTGAFHYGKVAVNPWTMERVMGWGRSWGIPPSRFRLFCIGATIMLPIASWERRFISPTFMAQSDEAAQGGVVVEVGSGENGSGGGADGQNGEVGQGEVKVEVGNGEDGSTGGADGSFDMMLVSSTHHRFAGLFTIRKPGAPPVTQLLVRGSRA